MAIYSKRISIIIISLITVLSAVVIILIVENIRLQSGYAKIISSKYGEFTIKLSNEIEKIVKEMEKKNSAKIMTFEETAMKLKLEKLKVRDLMDQLPSKKATPPKSATQDLSK